MNIVSGCVAVVIRRMSEAWVRVRRVASAGLPRLERIGGDLRIALTRIGAMSLETDRIGAASLRTGLVCSVGTEPREGIIWACDGRLITLEGGFLIGA